MLNCFVKNEISVKLQSSQNVHDGIQKASDTIHFSDIYHHLHAYIGRHVTAHLKCKILTI